MVEFIQTGEEEEKSPFEQYYLSEIVPAVEENNKIKDRYRTKFWGYFWTILFLMCANLLVIFFNFLLYNHPINYEQLALVNIIAFALIFYPIYQYYKTPRQNAFETFLAYYGNWKHLKNTDVPLVHSPIIPPHDYVCAKHNVLAEYEDWSMQLRDTIYQNFAMLKNIHYKRTVSFGIICLVEFKHSFKGEILLFEKRGFYRKSKFPGLQNVGSGITSPVAESFYIFANDADYAERMLPALFFERVLDLKEDFGAKRLYVEMRDSIMRLYFEGAQLYFDNDKFWSSKINKDKFIQLNNCVEQTLLFIETIKTLRDQHGKH